MPRIATDDDKRRITDTYLSMGIRYRAGFDPKKFEALTDEQCDTLDTIRYMALVETYLVTKGTRGASLEQVLTLTAEQKEKLTNMKVMDIQTGTTTMDEVLGKPAEPEMSLDEASRRIFGLFDAIRSGKARADEARGGAGAPHPDHSAGPKPK